MPSQPTYRSGKAANASETSTYISINGTGGAEPPPQGPAVAPPPTPLIGRLLTALTDEDELARLTEAGETTAV